MVVKVPLELQYGYRRANLQQIMAVSKALSTSGVIESNQYRLKFELDSIKKFEARTQSSFFLDVRNSIRKIVELFKLNSTKLESIKKFNK